LASSHLFEVPSREALQTAAALEFIHSYSLVHDDLPCMDNAEVRRGKPSCHMAFGEETATLVGDALIPLAFQTLASLDVSSEIRLDLIKELAQAIGSFGLVAGQMMDLNQEGPRSTVEDLLEQQRLKTGVLFAFATEAGAILGKANPDTRKTLRSYGLHFGEAFQMMDDWLDGHGDEEALGKPCDQDTSKLTFLNLCGAPLLHEKARHSVDKAIEALAPFQEKAHLLKEVAEYTLYRKK
jgi:farnesyl diphosphate synthase